MSKLNLLQLSINENEIVEHWYEYNESKFTHLEECISLMYQFIKKAKPEAWLFLSFLSQISKGLVLSSLSLLRFHEIQAQLMIRYSIESALLACYSLKNPNPDEFGKIMKDKSVEINKKIVKKASNWIINSYDISNLKKIKDEINNTYAHSSILSSQTNIKYIDIDKEFEATFYDETSEFLDAYRFYVVPSIIVEILFLIKKIINDFPLVTTINDFDSRLSQLHKTNENMRVNVIERFGDNFK